MWDAYNGKNVILDLFLSTIRKLPSGLRQSRECLGAAYSIKIESLQNASSEHLL
jgi:hypothetical protein